jgi:gamma-glutamylcyclotransferase (GGCT)/AIG2-like uncharacterized protein YtfP
VNDSIFLFVYGTLRKDEPGHELMAGARFVGNIALPGISRISDQYRDYPTAVEDGLGEVYGELYEVPTKDMPLIDDYEGSNYRRIQKDNIHVYVLKEETDHSMAATGDMT